MSRLSTAERNKLPSSAFVFPKTREFPIHDENHARDALAMAGRVEPEKAAKVRAAVKRRYPNIKQGDGEMSPNEAPSR